MAKSKGNLWTSVRDPSEPGPFGRASVEQLKALEKAILKTDLEKLEAARKAKQKACKHAEVFATIYVNLRGFYWEYKEYNCMDCGLESKSGIGIYANQPKNQNELEDILNTQVD